MFSRHVYSVAAVTMLVLAPGCFPRGSAPSAARYIFHCAPITLSISSSNTLITNNTSLGTVSLAFAFGHLFPFPFLLGELKSHFNYTLGSHEENRFSALAEDIRN